MHNYSWKEAKLIFEFLTDVDCFDLQRLAAGQLFSFLICIILSIISSV